MKKILFTTLAIIAFVFMCENLFSQGVAINTDGTTANPSAMLDVKSTNAGILVPRLTLAQRGAISNPATGLLIFQTDNTPGFYYNTGTPAVPSWIKLSIPTDNFDDADADATNELQTISISGHDITLSDGGGTVTVPDNNTTYSAGNQLSLSGTTFNVTEGSGSGLDADLLDGQHYSDIQSWVNTNDDNTTYSAGTGLTLTGTVFTPTFGTTAGTVSEGNHTHTNMVTGTGTTDYLARWTSTSTLGIGAVRDNGARVGIGTAPHTTYLAQFAGDLLLTTGWLRTTGAAGWYSETHGGGWYMTDATWIRSYGSKSIYHDSGILRTDGTFQVGASGATFNVVNGGDLSYRTNVLFANTTGNVGIGTNSPAQRLHVVGQIAIDDNNTRIFQGNGDAIRVQTASGYTDFGPQNAGWSHFSTDRPRFYFNTGLTVDSGNIGSYDENLSLQTSGSTRVTVLNSNGYVGINNTAPSEMLYVTGNVLASGIVYWGNAGTRTETRNDAGLQGDAGAKSGFYETSAPAPAANWPVGASSWWHLLDVRHSNNGNNYAMQFAGSFFDQNLYFRKTNASATTAWSRVMTSNDISGTTNYVSKFTGTNTIGNSQIFDNGTNVGIGTSGPSYKFHIVSTATTDQYTLYAYRPSGNYGGGRATIYGYRYGGSSGSDGTGYGYTGTDAAVQGYTFYGNLYAFGVAGHTWGDYNRTGGVIGSQYGGSYWGSLGYKNSGGTWYGAYWTSSGSGTGFVPAQGILTGVGSGGFGELMGGWSRGDLMGFATSGDMFALYNDGNSYTEGYSADIVKTDDGRKAAYSVTSTGLKIYDDGTSSITGTEVFVVFGSDFTSLKNSGSNPTITVTAIGAWAPLYIKEIRKDGFVVANENSNDNPVNFSWIAVGERIDSQNAELPKDMADDKFNENLRGVMFNENITNRNATPMWWDGSALRFDKIPEVHVDEAAKKAEEERMKNQ